MDLAEDLHVHSTFSDGSDSLEANLAAAVGAGLSRLGCVDHVRRTSGWVADYVRAVKLLGASTHVVLTAGIEAKLLDADGRLDLPPDFALADAVYIADHQFPWDDGLRAPRDVRACILDGTVTASDAIARLLGATIACMHRYADHALVLAHPFSILPKIGLDEDLVPGRCLASLASAAAQTRTTIEVSERWRCPSLRVARVFHDAGVTLASSTDSHRASTVGQYSYVAQVAAAVRGSP